MKIIKQKPIFNILSKENTHYKKQIQEKIIIDYREKNCLVASELVKKGFEIEFKELKVADYIVKNIAIERKTINDFISSIINKRIITQLIGLQQYENKLLLIEGIEEQELYPKENNRMHPNAIKSFVLSVLLKYKVPIVFSKNAEDTATFISILAKKYSKEASLNVTRKSFNKKEQLQFIIEGFPGIGQKTTKKLLDEFATIQNIINSSQEKLKKVIGKKAEIFNLVKEQY